MRSLAMFRRKRGDGPRLISLPNRKEAAMTAEHKPTFIIPLTPEDPSDQAPISIPKPSKSKLDRFKSTGAPSIAGVETLLAALPHHKLSETNDWARLHPKEAEYWSCEYCFVHVPIKGQKRDTLHLVAEEIAKRHLPPKRIQRFRLALASKPYDVFFLCHVPSQNLDNDWNKSNLQACLQGKTRWVQANSRKAEGANAEGYQIIFARNEEAFPEPNWPKQTLNEIIEVAFNGRMIDCEDHPGLLRLIGEKQSLS
jgi:hypothetical protein